MKIVIDIPERDYDLACKYPNALIATYAHYIKDGTPYEERPQIFSCFNCKYDYKSAADEPCKYCEKHCEWQAKEADNE